ncbi:MAG: arginine--tRNA ligase [Solirubrobacteraceae bacterium]
MSALAELHAAIRAGSPNARLERPAKVEFGDYSSNAALLVAKRSGRPPREVAEELALSLRGHPGVERVEIAGAGFLNIFLGDDWYAAALEGALADPGFGGGGCGAAARERIDIEFVSANPTGPLTVAHGRHAAYGDSLARILAFHGHEVTREFYVNDYGSQVQRLGESVRAHALGEPVADDGYKGDYVAGLVSAERARALSVEEAAAEAVQACLARIRATLERFGVGFDVWFSERSLHDSGAAAAALDALGDAVYRHEGALWLRTTALGDDKDRVLERSSGEHTYFASDIAYHQDKLARRYGRLIDIFGADHHGYVRRLRAAFELLGGSPDALELVILQFVHLVTSGERAAMSKRAGEFVTLDELLEQIGADAARFFLLQRSHETTVELDLDLAVRESSENPVYYVQYAHARIASMLARASGGSGGGGSGAGGMPVGALHPSERALIARVLAFPGEVCEAAERRAPHRIAAYALELAQDFTAFYRDCRVVGSEQEAFRLDECRAAQRTIAAALELLGVSAPQEM